MQAIKLESNTYVLAKIHCLKLVFPFKFMTVDDPEPGTSLTVYIDFNKIPSTTKYSYKYQKGTFYVDKQYTSSEIDFVGFLILTKEEPLETRMGCAFKGEAPNKRKKMKISYKKSDFTRSANYVLRHGIDYKYFLGSLMTYQEKRRTMRMQLDQEADKKGKSKPLIRKFGGESPDQKSTVNLDSMQLSRLGTVDQLNLGSIGGLESAEDVAFSIEKFKKFSEKKFDFKALKGTPKANEDNKGTKIPSKVLQNSVDIKFTSVRDFKIKEPESPNSPKKSKSRTSRYLGKLSASQRKLSIAIRKSSSNTIKTIKKPKKPVFGLNFESKEEKINKMVELKAKRDAEVKAKRLKMKMERKDELKNKKSRNERCRERRINGIIEEIEQHNLLINLNAI